MLSAKRQTLKGKIERFQLLQTVRLVDFFQQLNPRLNQVGQAGFGSKSGDKLFNFPAAAIVVDSRFFIDLFILGDFGPFEQFVTKPPRNWYPFLS